MVISDIIPYTLIHHYLIHHHPRCNHLRHHHPKHHHPRHPHLRIQHTKDITIPDRVGTQRPVNLVFILCCCANICSGLTDPVTGPSLGTSVTQYWPAQPPPLSPHSESRANTHSILPIIPMSDHVTWILASDWSILSISDHVTWLLASDWSILFISDHLTWIVQYFP